MKYSSTWYWIIVALKEEKAIFDDPDQELCDIVPKKKKSHFSK